MTRALSLQSSIGEVIAKLEADIRERQQMLAFLKAICSEVLRGTKGAPRKYNEVQSAQVVLEIARGKTHRQVAREMGIPISSVNQIAVRLGAKRVVGNRAGGSRVKGQVNHQRRHVALPRESGR